MTLEAVVFPQDQHPFPYPFRSEFVDRLGLFDPGLTSTPLDSSFECEWSMQSSASVPSQHFNEHLSADDSRVDRGEVQRVEVPSSKRVAERPKRRRPKSRKSREDIENQRMMHIAVERNRRKQMNEYLAALRSLIPASYCQRGDQASIIGGAINFMKELEYKIRLLEARKNRTVTKSDHKKKHDCHLSDDRGQHPLFGDNKKWSSSEIAEIEASMVESHANLKIRTTQRLKQLLKLISGLQGLRLTILYLNVLTVDEIIHYSFIMKAEDCCKLTSGEEISSAVHQIFHIIQQECCGMEPNSIETHNLLEY